MKNILAPVAAALLTAATTTASFAQDKSQIVAVNYPLQYFAERLVGDAAEVVFPVPSDVDPSFWRPGISDISTIQAADLILLNGAGFAGWVDRVSLPRSRITTVSAALEDQFIVTESITHSHGDGGEHSHEGLASYLWLDPTLASAQATAIAQAITAKGLADDEAIAPRLAEVQSDLSDLDRMAAQMLSGLGGVTLIATHPRYQYFAQRYDLSILSLEWEAGAMPSDGELQDLATMVSDTNAPVLIWEAAPPNAAIEAVEQLGLRSVVFDPMAHQPTGTDFVQSFAASVTALAEAISAPPGN